jgi:acetyl-CoA carboxylase alpha subunit
VADVVLSIVVGLHVPVILFVDIVGSVGAVAPEQIGAIALNVGTTFGLTVMFKVVVVAH